ncbi:hypothetical protein BGAL_0237g00120 [Botrytis galanthina]|uniref:Uncharacterized protein n=1 Tax=Botrytis galanthina TaxID=278940 RepID=A0A4S8QTN2_9HELO|nr:hypothetical protein BGAL_0237g00120 [Botrytis galanthina]
MNLIDVNWWRIRSGQQKASSSTIFRQRKQCTKYRQRERNKRIKPTTGEKQTPSPKNLRYMRQSTGVSNPWHGVTMSPYFEAQ